MVVLPQNGVKTYFCCNRNPNLVKDGFKSKKATTTAKTGHWFASHVNVRIEDNQRHVTYCLKLFKTYQPRHLT